MTNFSNLKTKTNLSPPWRDQGVGKTMRIIIPYNPNLVASAKSLSNNMTHGEVALWREIKDKKY